MTIDWVLVRGGVLWGVAITATAIVVLYKLKIISVETLGQSLYIAIPLWLICTISLIMGTLWH